MVSVRPPNGDIFGKCAHSQNDDSGSPEAKSKPKNKQNETDTIFLLLLAFVCAICMDEHPRIANIQQQQKLS